LYNNGNKEENSYNGDNKKIKAYIGRCNNSEADQVICKPEYAGLIDYTVYKNSQEEKSSERFSINKNDTIIDNETGLQWMKCTLGQKSYLNLTCQTDAKNFNSSFSEVQAYIDDFNQKGLAGKHDWRLPTTQELLSLVKCSDDRQVAYRDRCPDANSKQKTPLTYTEFSTFADKYITSGDPKNCSNSKNSFGYVYFNNGFNGSCCDCEHSLFNGYPYNGYIRLVRGSKK